MWKSCMVALATMVELAMFGSSEWRVYGYKWLVSNVMGRGRVGELRDADIRSQETRVGGKCILLKPQKLPWLCYKLHAHIHFIIMSANFRISEEVLCSRFPWHRLVQYHTLCLVHYRLQDHRSSCALLVVDARGFQINEACNDKVKIVSITE